VQPLILRAGVAAPIAEETGHWIMRATFQLAAKNIFLAMRAALTSVHYYLL
jgi:hypothetical protein